GYGRPPFRASTCSLETAVVNSPGRGFASPGSNNPRDEAAMVSEDAFQAALDDDPSNSCLRLVFADWLEEQGDWRAEGFRWLGSLGKYPYDWSRSTVVTGFHTFDWYLEDGGASWDVPYY